MTFAERIAAFAASVDLDRVPDAAIRAAKRCVADTVGVSLAATVHELPHRIGEHARRTYAAGPCREWVGGGRLSAPGAALVNGTAAHALDFDDTSYTGILHGSAVVLPAALAATEEAGGDGRRFLEAFIAGVEVVYAVSLLVTTRHYHLGWWSTATMGAFGAAAAAARALGLDTARTTAALALAGSHAGGLKASFGSDAKPWLAGVTAAAGVEAALLARAGLSGPRAVFEGRTGFLAMQNAGHDDAASLDSLGRVWRLVEPGVFFKQYPVCSGAHAAVEMTERLMREHGLAGDDVASVLCEVPPVVAISLVYERPQRWQEGQFSMPFAVGTMLARGRLDVAALTDATLADPRVRDAMARVSMRRDDTLHSDDAPEGARVTLTTTGGRAYTGTLAQPTGMPSAPLSDERLRTKFLGCAAAGGLDAGRAARLLAHLESVESAPSALPPWVGTPG